MAEAFERIRESGALACNPGAWAICVAEDVVLFAGVPNLPVRGQGNTDMAGKAGIDEVPLSKRINQK